MGNWCLRESLDVWAYSTHLCHDPSEGICFLFGFKRLGLLYANFVWGHETLQKNQCTRTNSLSAVLGVHIALCIPALGSAMWGSSNEPPLQVWDWSTVTTEPHVWCGDQITQSFLPTSRAVSGLLCKGWLSSFVNLSNKNVSTITQIMEGKDESIKRLRWWKKGRLVESERDVGRWAMGLVKQNEMHYYF